MRRPRAPFAEELDLREAPPALRSRFRSKVLRGEPDACWPWAAYTMRSGYGVFTLRKGEFITASRVALALTIGRLETGQVACHACDNPPCCNPAHLFVGTQEDNTLDCVRKGRARRARGVDTPSCKLTEDAVRAIRAARGRHGMQQQLATMYGVSATTIRNIRQGRTWAHLAQPGGVL